MSTSNTSRVTSAILVAVGIFLVAVVSPKFIFSEALTKIMTAQGLELLLTLLAIVILGKSNFSQYGFCRPQSYQKSTGAKINWIGISLMAPLLGIAASVMILVLGGSGNKLIKSLSIPQIILFVWFFSSIIEETFTRGFLQGHLSVLSGRYFKLSFIRIELPVMISALFFACMHFVLILSGIDVVSMVGTFLFTLSIGLMAGHLRAKTGSLIPAITVHILANVGGMIGGITYTLLNFWINGRLPGA